MTQSPIRRHDISDPVQGVALPHGPTLAQGLGSGQTPSVIQPFDVAPDPHPGVNPEEPRDKQMATFNAVLAANQDFHGTALVIGDSHAAEFDAPDLAAIFGTSGYINLSDPAADNGELWWIAQHAPTGTATEAGVDLSHVTRILIPDLGSSSLRYDSDSPKDIARQKVGLIRALVHDCAPGVEVVVTAMINQLREPHDDSVWSQGRQDHYDAAFARQAARHGWAFVQTPDTEVHVVDGVAHVGDPWTQADPSHPHDLPYADPYYWTQNETHFTRAFYHDYMTTPAEQAFDHYAT